MPFLANGTSPRAWHAAGVWQRSCRPQDKDLLSTSVNVMSYPHGDVNERVLCAVKKAGYLMAASSRPGGNNLSTDHYCLNRTDIWSTDDIKTFSSKINGSWDWMRFFIK